MKNKVSGTLALSVILLQCSLVAPATAAPQPTPKAAIDEKWGCIGANTSEGNPDKAKYANVKGCISDFAAPCEDVDPNDDKAAGACYRRQETIWEGVLQGHLIAEAKTGEAGKPGVAAAMTAAASAMRASRDKTCSFIRQFEVNTRPSREYYCRLQRTAEFSMLVYFALYTP